MVTKKFSASHVAILSLVAMGGAASPASAAVITAFNFDSLSGADPDDTINASFNASGQSGTLTFDSTITNNSQVDRTVGAGASGYGIIVKGGSGNNGKYIQISGINTTNFTDIQFSFDAQNGPLGNGFDANTLQYSVNGGSFTSFGSPINPADGPNGANPAAGSYANVGLINVPGAAGASSLALRIILGGSETNNSSHYLAFDNVTVSGTPVPVPAALWLLGSGIAGIGAMARRRRAGVVKS